MRLFERRKWYQQIWAGWVAKCVYDGRYAWWEERGRRGVEWSGGWSEILYIAHNKPIFVSASSEHGKWWKRRFSWGAFMINVRDAVDNSSGIPERKQPNWWKLHGVGQSCQTSWLVLLEIQSSSAKQPCRLFDVRLKQTGQAINWILTLFTHSARHRTQKMIKIYFFFTWESSEGKMIKLIPVW